MKKGANKIAVNNGINCVEDVNYKKFFLVLILCLMLMIIFVDFVSASDVAYVYRKDFKLDNNAINVMENMGLEVELIEESDISRNYDFSNYKFIFVGDERLKKEEYIPVGDFPVVIANSFYVQEWGLVNNRVSSLAGTDELEVRMQETGQIKQVYTNAFYRLGSTVSIPYYYLANTSEQDWMAPGLVNIAGSYTGNGRDLGAVIAYGNLGGELYNGKTINEKLCFFGLTAYQERQTSSNFWTPEAVGLFEDCIGYVSISCNDNSECGEEVVGDEFCIGEDVYRTISGSVCENPGSVISECVVEERAELVEECSFDCENGACIEPECNDGIDNEGDNLIDCLDPGCWSDINNPLSCNPLDDDEGDATTQCQDGVDNDGDSDIDASDIGCWVDPSDSSTYDPLDNNETDPEIECFNDLECGVDGVIGDLFCSGENVFDVFVDYECVNAGKLNAVCVNTTTPQLSLDCGVDSCDAWEADYCLGDDVYHNRNCYDRGCSGSTCFEEEEVESSLVEVCAFGCVNGDCIDGEHDVGFVDFTDSVNGIFLEYVNGSDILDGDVLMCGDVIKAKIKVENKGDYQEDVSLTGDVNGDGFSISNIDDLNSGSSSYRSSLSPYITLSGEGNFDVTIEGSIIGDVNPLDNIVIRNINVLCPECVRDADCDADYCDAWEASYCIGDDLHHDRNCYDNSCNGGTCGMETIPDSEKIEICEYGCANGDCLDPECRLDSDCGNDGFIGDRFCIGDDAYQEYEDFSCDIIGGVCESEIDERKVEDCADTCVDGDCVDVECSLNSDCGINGFTGNKYCINENSYEDYLSYQCINAGSANSRCEEDREAVRQDICDFRCVSGECINCFSKLDCGDDGFIDDRYCVGDDLYQDYEEFTCSNPGTSLSMCFDGVSDELIEECEFGCANGDCLDPECSRNTDCDADYCDAWEASYCIGNDVYRDRDCYDNGCINNACESDLSVDSEKIDECVYGCFNGDCLDECSRDSDCGNDGFIGDRFCIGDDAYQEYEDFSCQGGECSSSITENLVEDCAFGCSDGICNEPECVLDSDCDADYCDAWGNDYCVGDDVYHDRNCHDNSCLGNRCVGETNLENSLVEICEYGCANGDCNNECRLDSDCGTDGFIGDRFCIGDDAYQEYEDFECSLSGECSSEVDDRKVEDCADTCVDGDCVDIECSLNSDCGINGIVGNEFCSGDDIFGRFQTSICVNAGEVDSFCDISFDNNLIEDCGEDECDAWGGNHCVGDNLYHNRNCYDRGCSGSGGSSCFENQEVENSLVEECEYGCAGSDCLDECVRDSDCGNDGFIGDRFCIGDDAYQEYEDFSCNQGSCESDIDERRVEECADTCVDGECIEIIYQCSDDTDNDRDELIDEQDPGCWDDPYDSGTYNPQDDYEGDYSIACFRDLDCGDSWADPFICIGDDIYQRYASKICNNPGTIDSSCTSMGGIRKIEECAHDCANGECLNECDIDSDCGDDGFIGERFCENNDVRQLFREFECNSKMCSSEVTKKIIEECEFGCADSECILSDCEDDDDDNYDDCNPGETGDDGKEKDCNDRDDEINPGEVEVCDGKDNDCNGLIDDGVCEICDNGIDDDGDGLIDGLTELSRDNNFQESFGNTAPGTISTLIANKSEYDLKCSLTGSYGGILRSNSNGWSENIAKDRLHVTTEKVCNIFGYYDAIDAGCHDGERKPLYPSGKCNYHTPHNNCVFYWDGSEFQYTNSDSAKDKNSWITDLVCKGKIPECSDGKDNDGDGKIDYPEDDGCATPDDNSEKKHDPDCKEVNINGKSEPSDNNGNIIKRGPSDIGCGNKIIYDITVKSPNIAYFGFGKVYDEIPEGLIFDSAESSPECSKEGNEVVCDVEVIGVDIDSVSFQLVFDLVKGFEGDSFENRASFKHSFLTKACTLASNNNDDWLCPQFEIFESSVVKTSYGC